MALAWLTAMAGAGCVSDFARQAPATAEEKSIKFLVQEVPAWSRENGCFSCHNNGDAARALYSARRSGYRIPDRALADTTAWLRQPHRWEDNKGDPGFGDQRLANIQFAVSLLAAVESGQVKERPALEAAARKVAGDQDADGAWPIEPQNPVGSPATYGGALATFMAWRTLAEAAAPGTSEAMGRAERWMLSLRPVNIPTAAVLLLFSAKRRGRGL